MVNTITWLHISDLHIRSDTQASPSQSYGANIVFEKLLEDLKYLIETNELKIDFIAISGDIAYGGKWEEYLLAKDFFDRLLDMTKLTKDRLFPTPGNHDIDRNKLTTFSLDIAGIDY